MSYTISYDKSAIEYLIDTPLSPKRKLKKTRRDLGYRIYKYIKDRVFKKGMGAHGPLKGYSKKPFHFKKGKKPMWDADNFEGKVVPGGYTEYRQSVGLPVDHFRFSNMGSAWNDWDFKADDYSGVISIGFSNPVNTEVASYAADNGRPDMFELNDNELDMLIDGIIDRIERDLVGD